MNKNILTHNNMELGIEDKKNQFFGFIVILLLVGFLNYFRKVMNGLQLSRAGKILYLITMITFIIGTMFLLYFAQINNIVAFLIGLAVTALSENIAKMFLILGDKFNPIVAKVTKEYLKVDITKELTEVERPIKKTTQQIRNKQPQQRRK